ncbi:MAG TPA: hypothetical protein VG106_11935, partial [Vicinamibacterales bacterium]|nr:hypothetical protein [Vicinamibacterales bacterium]
MLRTFLGFTALTFLLWRPTPEAVQQPTAGEAFGQPLTVMTFNIRYGTAADGEDRWEKRRDLLFATIEAFKPD